MGLDKRRRTPYWASPPFRVHAFSPLMDDVPPSGLQAVILANRDKLLRFLIAHGAGDAAEDVLQDLYVRVATTDAGPVAQPLSYLYRAANNLMVDRFRSRRQAERREQDWSDAAGPTEPDRSDAPPPDRSLVARETLAGVQAVLDGLGARTATIFRRHRIEGVQQRDIARELGVSLSTVEADLRRAYRALLDYRRSIDEV
jgi:RNA polymerase sigma factor (sigma-70 family)